ncbi:DUF624 domain-containing protein [Bacillus sp. FJAT-49711]|uniref:YesL family protein n=1 Tax=Bacillus sp. FJAT-49711 TaxID=2833585 RepID=UPI001BCA0E98|nr:DUF624 domain-containing protein [Bacillus sp. FJAT-49711]MBS4217477.1 DUF624 domain-containing protein [Bacillus sp. FJAT-49711]
MHHIQGIFRWLYELGNGLAKAMYLHLLWILFTLLGLGVLGVIPATTALFSIAHQTMDKKREAPIFQSFFNMYKKSFIKSNVLGLLLAAVGVFLRFDLTISKNIIQSYPLHLFLLIIIFLYGLIALYFFPVFVRYELKGWQYFKQAFLISLARPFETIAILICLLLLYILLSYIPILFFYCGSSLIVFPIMWFAYRAFLAVEDSKQLKLKEKPQHN